MVFTTKVRLLLCDISPFVQPRAQRRAVSSLDTNDHPQCCSNAAVEQYKTPHKGGGGYGVIASEPAKVEM